jgi:hypothetical protein
MLREEFFDLAIATVAPGETAPADAHVVRVLEPSRREIEARIAEGWFYKPCYVTYVLRVPESLDAYIQGSFRSGTRNKPRRLLRDVPAKYRLELQTGGKGIDAFHDLYRRTIVARPRGRDRVGEHDEGFGAGWLGFISSRGRRSSPASWSTSCATISRSPTARSIPPTASSTSSTS